MDLVFDCMQFWRYIQGRDHRNDGLFFCCQSFYYLLTMYRRTMSLFCQGYRVSGQLLSWTRGDYPASAVKCSRGTSLGELRLAMHENSPKKVQTGTYKRHNGQLRAVWYVNSPIDLQNPAIQKKNGQLMPVWKGDSPIVNRKASREEEIG